MKSERREIGVLTAKNGAPLRIAEAAFGDLAEIARLQNAIAADPSIYFSLSMDELTESFREDLIYCVWDEKRLAAFAVIVVNRAGDRNLYNYLNGAYAAEEIITFDAVAVDEAYRGNGLQQVLIREALKRATATSGVKAVAATVSPDNPFSHANFTACGFSDHALIKAYGGLQRILCLKKL